MTFIELTVFEGSESMKESYVIHGGAAHLKYLVLSSPTRMDIGSSKDATRQITT